MFRLLENHSLDAAARSGWARSRRLRSQFALTLGIAGVMIASATLPAAAAPAFVAYHGVTGAKHQEFFDDLKGEYRMITRSIYNTSADLRYAAVWVKKAGPAWVSFSGLTPAQYQDKVNTWVAKDYRPTIVTATGAGADARFACVLEKDGVPPYARHGMTKDDFNNRNKKAMDDGWILRCATVYGTAADPRYAAIWEPNPGNVGWTWSVDLTNAQLNAVAPGFVGQGYRPAFVTLSANQKYLVIWRKDDIGSWKAFSDMTSAQYQAKFSALKADGYYPICVQGGGIGGGIRYAAIFAK